MIQIYSDGVLTYDSRFDEYALLALTTTTSVRKAGTATLTMPPGHPAYNAYTSYRSVVEIYRGGVLQFRGRALYPTDDFYNRRTITCEGERNFLRDGVHRPYIYQDEPAAIFEQVVRLYNAQVDEFKRFELGTVTVADPNNCIRLESERAETFAATIDALVQRCGGYITFTTNSAGKRAINWLADLGNRSQQVIEFGSNLLDFSRSSANTDLATVVIPYGAKDETTGEFVNIASVNGGLDFIQDYDAVALRGIIAQAVYWDDITEPTNLLAKAQQYLADKRNIVSSLALSAVDLSVLDKSIDDFQVGDLIRVRSKPHDVDDDFLLTERTDNLLDPSGSKVVLGKDELTLTGADAAGDRTAQAGIQKVTQAVKTDYGNKLNAVEKSSNAHHSDQAAHTSTVEKSSWNAAAETVAALVIRVEALEKQLAAQTEGAAVLTDAAGYTLTDADGAVLTTRR